MAETQREPDYWLYLHRVNHKGVEKFLCCRRFASKAATDARRKRHPFPNYAVRLRVYLKHEMKA